MTKLLLPAALLPTALLLSTAPLAQSSWTVDPSGGGDFVLLQDAIDAAGNGDLLQVFGANNTPGVIDGKSLILQGMEEVTVVQTIFASVPPLLVQNLASNQSVVARNIQFNALFPDPFEVVEVRDSLGAVHFEDCVMAAGVGGQVGGTGTGLLCVDAQSVTVARCTVLGLSGTFPHVAGLNSIDSNVFVYDSDVIGGTGNEEFCEVFTCFPASDGGPGAWVRGTSQFFASNSTIRGGDGGCDVNTSGAAGILMPDATAIARNRGSVVQGGTNGGGGCPGPDSAPVEGLGAYVELVGDARSFDITSPGFGGGSVTMSFRGEDGDFTFLLFRSAIGADPAIWFDPLFALHLDLFQLATLPVGLIESSGEISSTFGVPNFGPAPPFLSVSAQALFLTVGGNWVTTGPSVSLLIDD